MEILLGLLSFILIAPFALVFVKYGKWIHKNEDKIYIVSAIMFTFVGLASVYALVYGLDLKVDNPWIYAFFFQGHTAFALYVLVMFAGAFKHKSKAKTKLMMVRREMAIIGFIVLIPHMILLIWLALTNYNPTGTLAFLIMLPLFITSFRQIRKKMKPLAWRKLHKLAYAAYAMVYLHVASITIIFNILNNDPGDRAFGYIRFVLYTILFGVYTYLKFKNYILVPKATPKKA